MRKTLLLFATFLFCINVASQNTTKEVVIGDMNDDKELSVGDVVELVSTINGKKEIRRFSTTSGLDSIIIYNDTSKIIISMEDVINGGIIVNGQRYKFERNIDTEIPSTPSDERVPSTKLVDTKLTELRRQVGIYKETFNNVAGTGTTWKTFNFNKLDPNSIYTLVVRGKATPDVAEGATAFAQVNAVVNGATKNLLTINKTQVTEFPQPFSLNITGCTSFTFYIRFHDYEQIDVEITQKSNIPELNEASDTISYLSSLLGCVGYSTSEDASILKGTIYQGKNTGDNACLFDNKYYSARNKVVVVHEPDLLVRVSEYDIEKKFITQSNYKQLNGDYLLRSETRFVRISCAYTSRGYSDSNPISVDDYTKGDFYFILSRSTIVEKVNDIDFEGISAISNKEDRINGSKNQLNYKACIKGHITETGLISLNSDVWLTDYIYCKGETKVSYNYAGRAGFGVCFYDSKKEFIKGYTQNQFVTVSVPENAYYVRMNASYYNTTGMIVFGDESDLTPFEPYKGTDYIFGKIEDFEQRIPNYDNVINANADKVVAISSLKNASPNKYANVNRNLYPVYGVVTDIHSDWTRLQRALEYSVSVGATALLVLGDIGDQQASFDAYDWQSFVLNSPIPVLAIAGNHEFVYNSGQSSYTGYTDETLKDKLYNPALVSHNGEIHPNGKNYWHKDIVTNVRGSEYKLRIIGLYQHEFVDTWTDGHPDHTQNSGKAKDDVYYKQAQIDWLVNLLDSADANTHVMILVHWAVCDNNEYVDNPFNPNQKLGINVASGCNHGSNNLFIPQIIDAWIKGSSVNTSSVMRTDGSTISVNHTFASAHHGQFAGYLCGHTHYDAISKVRDVEEQFNYVFNCATATDGQQGSDTPRAATGKLQDSFAIIGYDFLQSKMGIVKIGSDVTVDMRDKKFGCNFNIADV